LKYKEDRERTRPFRIETLSSSRKLKLKYKEDRERTRPFRIETHSFSTKLKLLRLKTTLAEYQW
jgi:hypothetical protein